MKRSIAILATAVMTMTALTACGSQQSASSSTQSEATADENSSFSYEVNSEAASEGDNKPEKGGQHGQVAQVTAIDGSDVTIKLATNNAPQGDETKSEDNSPANGGEMQQPSFDGDEVQLTISEGMLKSMDMPQGGDKGGAPEGKPDGEKPSGEKPDGEAPNGDKADGEKPSGEAPNGEKPDGEKPEMNFEDNLKDMDISELAVGDVVNVVYDEDGTTVKYVVKSATPQS
jgi:hypothetical protein